jgi:TonB-linked SusC/RagA family outer membrane protein
MKKIFTLLFAFGLTISLLGQERVITGKVTDADGIGLPGVTVQLVGTFLGTATGIDGTYELTITENEGILRFSYIGFSAQEIPLTDISVINVVLLADIKTLNEVVVVGYGTQLKKDLTTAVSVVGEKDIEDRPITSAVQALQGKAAGVQVVQPSGKPGTALSVRVRGSTSVLAGNEPLYVVDGVPTTDIIGLSPGDIATMSVLKDASSSAIYGARAANGVVLITTKRGKDKEPVISFNMYYGLSDLRKTIDVLNTRRYRDLMEEISPGSIDPTRTDFNNWSDKTFGTGQTQSYQFAFSGGSDKSQYYLSIGYLGDDGIVEPAKFDRYSLRLNLDNELKSWLKIGTSISVSRLNTQDTPDNASSGRGGVIMSALNTPPFLNTYQGENDPGFVLTDETWYDPNPFQPSWENPIAYMYGPDQQTIENRISGSIFAEIKFLEDFTFKTKFGTDVNNSQWDYYLDPYRTNYGRVNNGIGRSNKWAGFTWLWENTLDYAKTFGKHNVSGLLGNSMQQFQGNNTYIQGNDFPADISVKTLNAANTISGDTYLTEWALSSFFGRATYDYSGKYYLTVTVRQDGSSKLAEPWGTMPSFSAGWRISSEKFMKDIDLIDDLKIRGGWGINGNQEGISNYAQYGLIGYSRRTPTNPLSGPASYQLSYGNPDLRWETTAQTNIGIDLTMFKARLTFTIDGYIKKTSDVLLNVQLPSTLPISTIQTNAGDIENRGIEFDLGGVVIDKEFKWFADFNMSFNRNEVTALQYTPVYYFGRIYSNNQDVSIVKPGLPLGSFFGYISEGVDPETGDLIYKDVDGNGTVNSSDRTVIGNAQPDFIFGFTNNFTWKRFDLNLFFQGSYGNDIYNATRIDLEGMFDSKNQSTAVLNRWTEPGQITDIPRVGNMANVDNSTRFVEDGSYVRLKALTFSYKIFRPGDDNKAFKNLSVYFTGQNLLTFTNYSGFDPEVNAFGNSATELGIDYGTYPQARTFIIGLNVEF